jgi:Flp pilus assembly protein TadD
MGRRRAEARKQRFAAVAGDPTVPDSSAPASLDPVEALIGRSRKARAKGDARRALVLLREACALDAWRARPFTLLGAALARAGVAEEAHQALAHARWLRARAGETARALVTARLAEILLPRAA